MNNKVLHVDNPVEKAPELVGNCVDKLWRVEGKAGSTVDNCVFSVDNPVGTVYKTPPNLWITWGFHAPNLWIICG